MVRTLGILSLLVKWANWLSFRKLHVQVDWDKVSWASVMPCGIGLYRQLASLSGV